MNKALIAMSGGVDSSIAAKLIKDSGYECIGCTMKLYDNEDIVIDRGHTCCSLDDVNDARSVAYKIGIPYYVFNFMDEFKETVIRNFVLSYEKGFTPNPCIECNRHLKFDKLFERAKVLGYDYVVTGHYARIKQDKDGRFLLKKAVDSTKDQSYVLYTMSQEQLAHALFPLGSLTKEEVRKLANSYDFVNANKPDSQDICFVPDGNYAAFIEKNSGKKYEAGNFVLEDGTILGTHKGIINYTYGQRKGLGISYSEPLYVKKINTKDNTVILGKESELYNSSLIAKDFNYISKETLDGPTRCKVKVRYRQTEQPATLTPLENNQVLITFDTPQRAITPGQSAVAYDGDNVLGGGTIISVFS